jgi:hypothetical protein
MSTTPSFPVVFGTEYSFYSNLGLYLSFHTASHYAILDSSPEGIWFEANGNGETGQPISTGSILFAGVEILAFDHWLYWSGSGDVYWTGDPNAYFEVLLFTDQNQAFGNPINVGDPIYFFFPAFGVYLSQDTSNTEYLTGAAATSALAWTIGTM